MPLKNKPPVKMLSFKKGQNAMELQKLRESAPTYEEVLQKFADLLHESIEMDEVEAKRANAELASTFRMVG